MKTSTLENGQSLIEAIIALTIGVLFITGATRIIALSLRLDFQNKFVQSAGELAQVNTEEVATMANASWHNLRFDSSGAPIAHAANAPYHLIDQGGFLKLVPSATTTTWNGQTYTISLTLADVNRDANGQIASAGVSDPSTVQIDATVSWQQNTDTGQVIFSRVLTRNRDREFFQTDWSGGNNFAGPVDYVGLPTTITNKYFTSTNIATNTPAGQLTIKDLTLGGGGGGGPSSIDSTIPNYYAWNDVFGWIDFHQTNTVGVSNTELTGYANSGVGYIALNCNSAPNGSGGTHNICPGFGGASQFSVVNDGSGYFAGYGWSDQVGWISFCGNNSGGSTPNGSSWLCPGSPTYQVTMDTTTGDFHGWAWNDVVGWISFNCDHTTDSGGTTCGAHAYKVRAILSGGGAAVTEGTLISTVFNTGQTQGAGYNTIIWQGTQPAGTAVKFQIATSNSSAGPWTYLGPGGSALMYYTQPAGANLQIPIPRDSATGAYNTQYIRYKVFLESDSSRSATPTITDIAINWSL